MATMNQQNAFAALSRPLEFTYAGNPDGTLTDGGQVRRVKTDAEFVPARWSEDMLAEVLIAGVDALVSACWRKHDPNGDADRDVVVARILGQMDNGARPREFEGSGRSASGMSKVDEEMFAAFKLWFGNQAHALKAANDVTGTGKRGIVTVADVVRRMCEKYGEDFAKVLDDKGTWNAKAIIKHLDKNAPHRREQAQRAVDERERLKTEDAVNDVLEDL